MNPLETAKEGNALQEQQNPLVQDIGATIDNFPTSADLYPTTEAVAPEAPVQVPVVDPSADPTMESGLPSVPQQSSTGSTSPGLENTTYSPLPELQTPLVDQPPPIFSGRSPDVQKDPVTEQLGRIKLNLDRLGAIGSQTPAVANSQPPFAAADAEANKAWWHYLLNPLPTETEEGYLELIPRSSWQPGLYVKNVGTLGGAFDWLTTPLRSGYGLLADTQRGYYFLRRNLAQTPGGRWFNDLYNKHNLLGLLPPVAALNALMGDSDGGLEQAYSQFNQPNMFPEDRNRFLSMFPNLTAGTVGAWMSAFDTEAQTRAGSDLSFELGASAEFKNPFSGTFLGFRNPFTGEKVFDQEQYVQRGETGYEWVQRLPGQEGRNRLGDRGWNLEKTVSAVEGLLGYGTLFVSDVANPINLLLDIPADKAIAAIGRTSFWRTTAQPWLANNLGFMTTPIGGRGAAEVVTTVQAPQNTPEQALTTLRAQLTASGMPESAIDEVIARTRAGLNNAQRPNAGTYSQEQALEVLRDQLTVKYGTEVANAQVASVEQMLNYRAAQALDPEFDKAEQFFKPDAAKLADEIRTDDLNETMDAAEQLRDANRANLNRIYDVISTLETEAVLKRESLDIVENLMQRSAAGIDVTEEYAELPFSVFKDLEDQGIFWNGDTNTFRRENTEVTPKTINPEAEAEAKALLADYEAYTASEGVPEFEAYDASSDAPNNVIPINSGLIPTEVPLDRDVLSLSRYRDYLRTIADPDTNVRSLTRFRNNKAWAEEADRRAADIFNFDESRLQQEGVSYDYSPGKVPLLMYDTGRVSLEFSPIDDYTRGTVEGVDVYQGKYPVSVAASVDGSEFAQADTRLPIQDIRKAKRFLYDFTQAYPEAVLVIEGQAGKDVAEEYRKYKFYMNLGFEDILGNKRVWSFEEYANWLAEEPRLTPTLYLRTPPPEPLIASRFHANPVPEVDDFASFPRSDIPAPETHPHLSSIVEPLKKGSPVTPAVEPTGKPKPILKPRIETPVVPEPPAALPELTPSVSALEEPKVVPVSAEVVTEPEQMNLPDSLKYAERQLAELEARMRASDAELYRTVGEYVDKTTEIVENIVQEAEQLATKVVEAEDNLDNLREVREQIDGGLWTSEVQRQITSDATRLGVNTSGTTPEVARRLETVSAPSDRKLAKMTVAELKSELKKLGIRGYSKLNKQQLIDLLKATYADIVARAEDVNAPVTERDIPDNPTAIAADEYDKAVRSGQPAVEEATRLSDQLIHENTTELIESADALYQKQYKLYETAAKQKKTADTTRATLGKKIDAATTEYVQAAAKADTVSVDSTDATAVVESIKNRDKPPVAIPKKKAPVQTVLTGEHKYKWVDVNAVSIAEGAPTESSVAITKNILATGVSFNPSILKASVGDLSFVPIAGEDVIKAAQVVYDIDDNYEMVNAIVVPADYDATLEQALVRQANRVNQNTFSIPTALEKPEALKYKLVDLSAIRTPSVKVTGAVQTMRDDFMQTGRMLDPIVMVEIEPDVYEVVYGFEALTAARQARELSNKAIEMVDGYVSFNLADREALASIVVSPAPTKAVPKAAKFPENTSIVDIDSIDGVPAAADSELAVSIAETGVVSQIPIVIIQGIDSYRLAYGGDIFAAYNQARKVNATLPDRMRVWIVPDQAVADAMAKQSGMKPIEVAPAQVSVVREPLEAVAQQAPKTPLLTLHEQLGDTGLKKHLESLKIKDLLKLLRDELGSNAVARIKPAERIKALLDYAKKEAARSVVPAKEGSKLTINEVAQLAPVDQVKAAYNVKARRASAEVDIADIQSHASLDTATLHSTLKQMAEDDLIELIPADPFDMTPSDLEDALTFCGMPIKSMRFL